MVFIFSNSSTMTTAPKNGNIRSTTGKEEISVNVVLSLLGFKVSNYNY